MRTRYLLAGLLLLGSISMLAAQQAEKDWTVLVYIVADNNLESAAVADLLEMVSAKYSGNSNVIVEVDRRRDSGANGDSSKATANIPNFTGTKVLEVQNGKFREIQNMGQDLVLTEPRYLQSFLSWGFKRFPAKRLAVVLWDHGGGWTGYGSDDTDRSYTLTPDVISSSIANSLRGSGHAKIDFLGFDACLMASYEVAKALQPVADYLLASEETEPGHGWDYAKLSILSSNPTPMKLADELLRGYSDQALQNGQTGITMSVINLGQISLFDGVVDGLIDYLSTKTRARSVALGQSRYKAITFGSDPDPYRSTMMTDLGELLRQLSMQDATAKPLYDSYIQARNAVIPVVLKGGTMQNVNGLSIYFPNSIRYYNEGYNDVDAGNWRNVLATYYENARATTGTTSRISTGTTARTQPGNATNKPEDGGSGVQTQDLSKLPQIAAKQVTAPAPVPPTVNPASFRFTNPDFVGDAFVNQQGVAVIQGRLPKAAIANAVTARLYYGIKYLNDYWFTGSLPAQIRSNDELVEGSWNFKTAVITQGKLAARVFLYEEWQTSDFTTLRMPFYYYDQRKAKGNPQILTAILQVNGKGEIVSQNYYGTTNGMYSEVVPSQGSEVVPALGHLNAAGNVEYLESLTEGAFDPNGDMKIDFRFDDYRSSEVVMYLEAADAGEAVTSVSFAGLLKPRTR